MQKHVGVNNDWLVCFVKKRKVCRCNTRRLLLLIGCKNRISHTLPATVYMVIFDINLRNDFERESFSFSNESGIQTLRPH